MSRTEGIPNDDRDPSAGSRASTATGEAPLPPPGPPLLEVTDLHPVSGPSRAGRDGLPPTPASRASRRRSLLHPPKGGDGRPRGRVRMRQDLDGADHPAARRADLGIDPPERRRHHEPVPTPPATPAPLHADDLPGSIRVA